VCRVCRVCRMCRVCREAGCGDVQGVRVCARVQGAGARGAGGGSHLVVVGVEGERGGEGAGVQGVCGCRGRGSGSHLVVVGVDEALCRLAQVQLKVIRGVAEGEGEVG